MVKLKHTWMSVEMKLMFRGGFEGLVVVSVVIYTECLGLMFENISYWFYLTGPTCITCKTSIDKLRLQVCTCF